MTGKEAIKVLLDEWKCIDRNDGINCDRKCEKCDLVMDSAILKEAYNMAIKALEQEPCDDVVSRQAVLDCFNNNVTLPCDMDTGLLRAYLQAVVDAITELPPVRPQEQTGHWLYSGENGVDRWTCDNCFDFVKKPTKVCTNCGAKMIEP